MLAWLSDHALELKLDKEFGPPPSLAVDTSAWFHHFDYDGDGLLAKSEVIRGIAKMMYLSADSSTAKEVNVATTLKNLIESIWDSSKWPDGVPLKDFVGAGGLAQKILTDVPSYQVPLTPSRRNSFSVQEALAKARSADLQESESYKVRLSPAMIPKVYDGELDLSGMIDEMDNIMHFIQGYQNIGERELTMDLQEDDLPCEQPVLHPRASLVRKFQTLQALMTPKEQPFEFDVPDPVLMDLGSEFVDGQQPRVSYLPHSCSLLGNARDSRHSERKPSMLANWDGIDITVWQDADGQESMLITV
jgi:hypothetical protein